MLLPKEWLRLSYSIFSFCVLTSKIRAEDDIGIDDILDKDYDYLHPPKINNEPVEVNITISKISLRSIDESDMSFSVTLEMYQTWIDHRLRFPSWATGNTSILDSKWIDKLWNAKIYFLNAVDGKMDNIISPSSFFWLRNNGRIYYCCRVILKLICEMDLKFFPHDQQECSIQMGSSIFGMHDVILQWTNTARVPKLFSLQQFLVNEFRHEKFIDDSRRGLSCLKLTVVLQRRTGYYLINVYIPTILIVIMSMLTFWIPPDAVPARVTLGVTSLLTIITKQYQASMPAVSYIVALNVWLSCCIGFVFFSLLEFAAVIALSNNPKKQDKGHFHHPDMMIPLVMLRSNGTWSMKNDWSSKKPTHGKKVKENLAPRRLDLFSRIFFPVAFIVFAITYWIFYN